ncbi:MAG: sodium-dependent transporter [Gammaproteobacteria bacterium]|nr:sodium-dependent transporter [Gammaproteobacteria bacterium]
MPTKNTSIHGEWSSRLAFILAAAGSAVGLGNIWKFPYMAGENGGGAFVLIYLACIALFGLPIMMAEVMLGRRGRQSPINTMKSLSQQENTNKAWGLLGWSGVLAGVLILSYYSVIAGWSLSYVLESISGSLQGINETQAGELFSNLVASPLTLIFWHTLFMVMTMFVVSRGVSNGLEAAVKYLMPALAVLIFVLIGYSISQGNFMLGVEFMFTPDFSKIDQEVLLDAMGQAFFSLSLGMGAIMIYGSYLSHKASIARTSFAVAFADTSIAILAGLAIFPIVFAYQLEAAQGPGLIFNTLPLAFGQMPGGIFFGSLFFVLLVFAAWTSSISLIEPAVAWLVERRGFTRIRASIICGFVTWSAGLGTVFSFNIWKTYTVFDKTVFDLLDFLTSNIMLPLGGLLIAVFVGWSMRESSVKDEIAIVNPILYQLWRFLIRFVTPLGVLLIFLRVIGII